MLFDSHVHSAASPDSETSPDAAIRDSRGKGLGIIFTEHVDFAVPAEKADPAADDRPKTTDNFIADFHVYPGKYEEYRADDVLLGLEIGLTKAFYELNKQTAEAYGYDFILGSVHNVDGYDIYRDFCNQEQYEDHYARLLEYTKEMIEISDFFDSLAHIDYISRVSPFSEKNILFELYRSEYDAVLSLLAERGKAIEINTSRLEDVSARKNLFKIYKRFGELGGRYITIGSDAHIRRHIGRNFAEAERIAKEAGLKVVKFSKRKRYV